VLQDPVIWVSRVEIMKCIFTGFEAFTAVLLKLSVFWDVMLCHWASSSSILEDYSFFIFRVKQSGS
jgi:hypothetical protein